MKLYAENIHSEKISNNQRFSEYLTCSILERIADNLRKISCMKVSQLVNI